MKIFILIPHLNLFKIKFKIVSNIQWLKDSLSDSDTIFVIIIFSWNYTCRMESQIFIYLDNIFGIHDKNFGRTVARTKNQNSSPLLYNLRKYQHSCKIIDHNGEKVIAFEDLVKISASCFFVPIHSKECSFIAVPCLT